MPEKANQGVDYRSKAKDQRGDINAISVFWLAQGISSINSRFRSKDHGNRAKRAHNSCKPGENQTSLFHLWPSLLLGQKQYQWDENRKYKISHANAKDGSQPAAHGATLCG